MSVENVELVLESIRRFNPGTLDEWAELWHPDVRFFPPKDWPEPGPFIGLKAVTEEFRSAFGAWADLGFEDVEVVGESGDWVVMTFRVPTRGATSGLGASFDLAAAYRIEAGLLIELVVHWDTKEALEAAGLSG
jgi:ketosteroid isomerase-like protein